MKIFIKTKVKNSLPNIHAKFNREFFENLAPPIVDLTIERFDGCLKGDEIHLSLKLFGLVNSKWVSRITTSEYNAQEFYFIDEGLLLPPPLTQWRHVHSVEKIDANNCFVIDSIEFKTNSPLLDKVIYPALYAMFLYRRPIYKSYLSHPN